MEHRAEFPHVKARPAGPPGLPPQARLHRAHLTVVFAALAVTRFIEHRTGWWIKKFGRTARRYRIVQIRVGQHILTAGDPLPPHLRDTLTLIK